MRLIDEHGHRRAEISTGARGRGRPAGRGNGARATCPERRRPGDSRVSRGCLAGVDRVPILRRGEPRLGHFVVGRRGLFEPLRAGRRERRAPGRSCPTPCTRGSTRRAPKWPSSSPMPGRDGGSRRSCSPTSPRRPESGASSTFVAEVLPHNHRMIDVFRQSGFPVELRSIPDALEIELPTSLSAEALERFEERDRIGAVAAVRSFLEPRSVAVIGASRRRGTIGGEILHNLLAAKFNGAGVRGQRQGATWSSRCPRTGRSCDIPGPVELAVVAVPAEQVVGVARECAAAGVRALLVISSGFAETGAEGASAPARAARGVPRRRHPDRRPELPRRPQHDARRPAECDVRAARDRAGGSVGFMSQSGGLGIAIIEAAEPPRRRAVVVRRRSATRPICRATTSSSTGSRTRAPRSRCSTSSRSAIPGSSRGSRGGWRPPSRSWRSRAAARRPGARATSSHTGAMLSASDVTVDALFEQAGVIRTDTMHELFDVAALLSAQPVPRGDRVAIVTNGGGPASCAPTPARRRRRGRRAAGGGHERGWPSSCPRGASLGNPIDMIATASAEDYRRTLQTLIDADACDAIITIFVPPLVTAAERRRRARSARWPRRAGRSRSRPCSWSATARPRELTSEQRHACPVTSSPRRPPARSRWPPGTARWRAATRGVGADGSRGSGRWRPRRSSARSSRGRTGWLAPADAWRSCSTATGCR